MEKLTAQMLEKEYIKTKEQIDKLQSKLLDIKQLLIEAYEDEALDNRLLTVYYIPPKKVISWKAVAEELEPSTELVEKYSKLSKPSYGIKIKKEKEPE